MCCNLDLTEGHFHLRTDIILKYNFLWRELNLWFSWYWERKAISEVIHIAFQKSWRDSNVHLISSDRVQAPKKRLKGKIHLKGATMPLDPKNLKCLHVFRIWSSTYSQTFFFSIQNLRWFTIKVEHSQTLNMFSFTSKQSLNISGKFYPRYLRCHPFLLGWQFQCIRPLLFELIIIQLPTCLESNEVTYFDKW